MKFCTYTFYSCWWEDDELSVIKGELMKQGVARYEDELLLLADY